MKIFQAKPYLYAELVMLTLVIPAIIYRFDLVKWMLPILWVIALYCYALHRRFSGKRWREDWGRGQVTRAVLKPVLRRFVLCAVFLAVATWLLAPDMLFSLMRTRPVLWVAVMILYPLISVLPQEIIFRLFFFERYQPIFKTRELMVIASGLSFGLAHIIFHNWVAPLLCAVGGILFAMTYAKHRSLALVSLEHALFGDFIFTIGLGFYFYHGSVAAIAAATSH